MVRVTLRPPSDTLESISYQGRDVCELGEQPWHRQHLGRITWGHSRQGLLSEQLPQVGQTLKSSQKTPLGQGIAWAAWAAVGLSKTHSKAKFTVSSTNGHSENHPVQQSKVHNFQHKWALRKAQGTFPGSRNYLSEPGSTDWEGQDWQPGCHTSCPEGSPAGQSVGHATSSHSRHTYLTKPCCSPFPFALFPPLPFRGATDVLKVRGGKKEKTTEWQQILHFSFLVPL